jgi:parallel beta-helix repeat protein
MKHVMPIVSSKTTFLIVLLIFLASNPASTPLVKASPGTIQVPSPQYPTIQAGVNAANPGDTILVSSGTYKENVIITKSLNLVGAGSGTTIIDAQARGPGINVTGLAGVLISGFAITDTGFFDSAVLIASSYQVTLSHNKLQASSQSNGTSITNSNAITVIDNVIMGNLYGVAVQGGFNNLIQGDNATGNAIGLGILSSPGNVVRANRFQMNQEGVRIWYTGSSGNILERNLIANNTAVGISLQSSGNNRVIENEVSFNNAQPSTEGVYLSSSTGNNFYSNNIRNNTIQIFGVYGNDITANTWNNGSTKPRGNFWSDYNGVDTDADGIGDTLLPWPCPMGGQPCTSRGGPAGVDMYPLMKPWLAPPLNVTAKAQPSSGCPSPQVLPVSFNGSAQGGINPYNYAWNFGDGTNATGQQVTHSYAGKGSFFATLTVRDSSISKANGTDTLAITVFSGSLILHISNGQNPISSANVTFLSQPPGQPRLSQLTNPQGLADFPCLAPGPYVVQVSSLGYQTGMKSFTMANQTVNLSLTLAPNPSSFPTAIVVAAGIGAAVLIALGILLVYRRRRNLKPALKAV